MKKRNRYIICLGVFLIVFGMFFIINKQGNHNLQSANKEKNHGFELKPVEVKKGDMILSVDPRIELLMSIELNVDYPMLSEFESNYKKNMIKHFEGYKTHKITSDFTELQKKGFMHHVPPSTMMHIDNSLIIDNERPFDEEIIRRVGGEPANIEGFITELKNYAEESHFQDFFNSNRDYYEELLSQVNEIVDHDLTEDLSNYYGSGNKKYKVIISPIIHNGGFAHKIKGEEEELYGFIGPSDMVKGNIQFANETISEIIWHEFSHSFVNNLTRKNIKEVDKHRRLYDPIKDAMEAQFYGSWEICVNEHIVRAVTARLHREYYGEEKANEILREMEKRGFIYIQDLYEKLGEYEQERKKYKSFEDFYLELISVFEEIEK